MLTELISDGNHISGTASGLYLHFAKYYVIGAAGQVRHALHGTRIQSKRVHGDNSHRMEFGMRKGTTTKPLTDDLHAGHSNGKLHLRVNGRQVSSIQVYFVL